MSQGGTKKAQLEELDAQLKVEEKAWQDAGLPNPGNIYVMGPDQFQYALKIQALTVIVNKHLGISEDDMEIEFKKILVIELKKLREAAVQAKSEMIREQLTKGITMQPPKLPPNGAI